MMVLVDTSVWIRFFSNRHPYADELDRLLSIEAVSSHELVYGELLIGDRGGRKRFLDTLEALHQAAVVPHAEVVDFVRARQLHGRGAGWIDIHLLASAIVSRLKLWTADPRLHELAKELGVVYQLPENGASR